MRPTPTIRPHLQGFRTASTFGSLLFCASLCILLLCHAAPASGDQDYMTITFDDKAIDQPIGTGGPANGEPSSIDESLSAIVRSTPFSTPCLEIGNTGNMNFDLAAPVTGGIVAVITDIWFYQNVTCQYYVSLRNSSNQVIDSIFFWGNGIGQIAAYDFVVDNVTYPTGRPTPILMVVDLDARTWSVWIDEVQWVNGQPLFEQISDFKRVLVSAGGSCPEGNRCSIDQIRILDRVPPVPVETLSWGGLRALYR
jgi:hypothetical protein